MMVTVFFRASEIVIYQYKLCKTRLTMAEVINQLFKNYFNSHMCDCWVY